MFWINLLLIVAGFIFLLYLPDLILLYTWKTHFSDDILRARGDGICSVCKKRLKKKNFQIRGRGRQYCLKHAIETMQGHIVEEEIPKTKKLSPEDEEDMLEKEEKGYDLRRW